MLIDQAHPIYRAEHLITFYITTDPTRSTHKRPDLILMDRLLFFRRRNLSYGNFLNAFMAELFFLPTLTGFSDSGKFGGSHSMIPIRPYSSNPLRQIPRRKHIYRRLTQLIKIRGKCKRGFSRCEAGIFLARVRMLLPHGSAYSIALAFHQDVSCTSQG